MKWFSGIGGKIFISFIVLVLTGLVVGSIGYFSLNKVVEVGGQERLANRVESRLYEARQHEKDLIIRKDDESFKKLDQALELLSKQAEDLKAMIARGAKADEIKEAQIVYKKKASDLKQLFEDDARALATLQQVAAKMMKTSEEQSNKAISEEKDLILNSSAATLKQSSLNRIKEVVNVGHDVLKYYHDKGLPLDNSLDVIRNMHFEGSNYYFVVKEDLTLIAHGSDRKLEGMDFGKIQDKKTGRTFMKDIVSEAMSKGDSYTEYFWTKPGKGDAVFPKVTFAKHFKPWGIIICAGAYIDDIEQEIAKTGTLLQNGFEKLQQANAILEFTAAARLNALYYFAFEQNAPKVGEALGKLKALPVATEDLKREADTYLKEFTRRVKNNEDRIRSIAEIETVASKAQSAAKEVSKEAEDGALKTAGDGKTYMVTFVLSGAFAGVLLALLLVRVITKPLRRVITGLSESSEQVTSASCQVASSSQQLANGASDQAAAIEETSSSMEEMASMTRQNATNASQAKQSMKAAEDVVRDVDAHLKEMAEAMNKINQSSEETIKIIKTIDEIAFQTNLLALNAAVEAARAGEAGAGFAVVADEVRNLAMRAAEAAKNTSSMIENTLKAVRHGNELTGLTQEAFKRNIEISTGVSGLVDEITAASQEQAQGVDQVNKAVCEMDKLTQRNAANAEESASASEEMNTQAELMKSFVQDLMKLVGGSQGGGTKQIASLGGGRTKKPRTLMHRATKTDVSGIDMNVAPEKLVPFEGEGF